MVKFISKNVITGLVAILPVWLTLYLLYWLAVSAEAALGGMLKWLLPDSWYWPGMGIAAGVGVIFLIGVLMHAYVFRSLFKRCEQLFYRMPIIKTVYRSIRDFFDYFSLSAKKEYQQVVAVTLGDTGVEVVGLVTQSEPDKIPLVANGGDKVLVYLPMSYMIGGYAVLVPRERVRPLDMGMEEAMRFCLTAGVAGGNREEVR